jgi:acetyl esterase/lipase
LDRTFVPILTNCRGFSALGLELTFRNFYGAIAVTHTMRMFLLSLSFIILLAAFVYHFAALMLFNALVPKDDNTKLIAGAVSYGRDHRQQLDIYAPSNATEPLPIMLFVYGGSWNYGNREGYEFIGRAFAARGYLTLVMDYRLMPDNRFPAFVEDVASALAWAEKEGQNYGGDPKRIFAVGHSAGAYNLAMAVLDKHYLEAAGADLTALRGVATLAGPFDFLPLDTKVTTATFGQEPDLAKTQPVNYARADAPPFCLLTGIDDTTVYPKNSRALEKTLREKGAEVELHEYKGLGHVGILLALAKPFRNPVTPVIEDILAFFAKHDVKQESEASQFRNTGSFKK